MKTVYDFSVKDRKGKDVSLKEYANEVLLIVNTATKCGFTPQYDELEALYKKYHAEGFEILDFPCNQFGQQAPGTDESIHEFCKLNFGTDFPRFKKIKVNGEDADPLYKFLQEQKGFAGWDMNHPIAPILEDMLSKEDPDYKQKLWDHLAIMSNFQLDIDWPYDISGAAKIATKPEPLEYPMAQIPVRHYGKMLFEVFEQLKTMPAGEERDELVRQTANQMKRNLYQWSHGSADDEKIASDLARFTDGHIQLDLDTFTFEKLDFSQMQQQVGKKKRR